MTKPSLIAATLPALIALASCSPATDVDSTMTADAAWDGTFTTEQLDTLDQPWAASFVPGTKVLVATTKPGKVHGWDLANGKAIFFSGVPEVDYGGQGGLGDIAFLESEAGQPLSGRTIYLSWAEHGERSDNPREGTRGAVVGRGKLLCEDHQDCQITGMEVIWRQAPKTTGRGHYSHRIAFSPDEKYMFVASGDRQKMEPAQDAANTIGTIVRLNLDGTPAAGNPLADRGAPSNEIWSWGHRNILGMAFNAEGQLWEVEHGPKGGDELNLVKKGANYGWPTRSYGIHYNNDPIPDHVANDGFAKPALWWTPVIAPGDMLFYSGDLFPGLAGDALIAGLSSNALVRIDVEGETAREVARYGLDARIRAVVEGPDGALYVFEDGDGAKVLKLTPG